MENKKSIMLGLAILVIIAITVSVFAWKVDKERKAEQLSNADTQKEVVSENNSQQNQDKQSAENNVNKNDQDLPYNPEPEQPICDANTNKVNWDESKNGYFYTKNTNYFTFSYPCDYEIHYSDMAGFYHLDRNNPAETIYIFKSSNPSESDGVTKKTYPNSEVRILNDKLKIEYPYTIYLIQISKNSKQNCGECFMRTGHDYNKIEIKVNNKLYYQFVADSAVDKGKLFNIAGSFVYQVIDRVSMEEPNWKKYSNERIAFSYPNECEFSAVSDKSSEKSSNMYYFENCFGGDSHWQILLYEKLDQKYIEDKRNMIITNVVDNIEMFTGEKIEMLQVHDDATNRERFLSYIIKDNSDTALEVFGPNVNVQSEEITAYKLFIKNIKIK